MPVTHSRARLWQRPVAFLHNGHGDKLLALPALRALCDLFQGRLRLLGGPGDEERYAELPLRRVCEIPFERKDTGSTWCFDAGQAARAIGDADLLLSLNSWYNEDVVALLGQLPRAENVGFFRPFTHRLSTPAPMHIVDRLFQLARWVEPSLDVDRYSYPPAFSAAATEAALRIRESLPPPRRVLAVHMSTLPQKMWALERWRRLLLAFVRRHPDYLVFVLDRTPLAVEMPSDRIVPIIGLPLLTAFALVGTCDLFVGIDSCMLHAADLYRVPGVGLFGPTPARNWGYRFTAHRHLCSPAGGLDGISAESVLDAIEALLPVYPSALDPAGPERPALPA